MKGWTNILSKPARTFMLADRPHLATVSVCSFARLNQPLCLKLEVKAEVGKLAVSIETTGIPKEILVIAAEIVHEHMSTEINPEALQVALAIARGNDESKSKAFAETAKRYLKTGVTVVMAQSLPAGNDDIAKEIHVISSSIAVRRAENMLHVGRHIREMSRQSFQLVA